MTRNLIELEDELMSCIEEGNLPLFVGDLEMESELVVQLFKEPDPNAEFGYKSKKIKGFKIEECNCEDKNKMIFYLEE